MNIFKRRSLFFLLVVFGFIHFTLQAFTLFEIDQYKVRCGIDPDFTPTICTSDYEDYSELMGILLKVLSFPVLLLYLYFEDFVRNVFNYDGYIIILVAVFNSLLWCGVFYWIVKKIKNIKNKLK